MPGLTGPELAGQLWAARPDLPVIFCTGDDSIEVTDPRIRAVLDKPTRLDAIRKVLPPAQGPPALARQPA
jgi:FixJ family two-component response regulator